MKTDLLLKLMEKNNKAVWCFDLPQVATKTSIDLTKSTNAEISTNLYNNFECVWLFESPVNFYYNWKQIIISGLKMLSPKGGFIVIKSYNMILSNEQQVLQFLKNYLVDFKELDTYFELKRGYRVSIFQIFKKSENLPSNSNIKAKNKKVSNFIVHFYKMLFKLKIKR